MAEMTRREYRATLGPQAPAKPVDPWGQDRDVQRHAARDRQSAQASAKL